MSDSIREKLTPIFLAVRILNREAITFNEEAPIPVVEGGLWPQFQQWHDPPATPLLATLTDILYSRCYYREVTASLADETRSTPAEDAAFERSLSQANQSRERWDTQWNVVYVQPNGRIRVQKGERSRFAMPGEYVFAEASGGGLQVGQRVTLYVPCESSRMMPGFFFVFGETLAGDSDEFHTVRFYFNVTAEGTPPLIEMLTRELNRLQVPFRLKCMNRPADCVRSDASVLYVGSRYVQCVARVVGDLPDVVGDQLRSPVPLFTKMLHAGIGVAEEPKSGASFGQHRCRLLAEGMIAAFDVGSQDPERRFDAVKQRFELEGISLDRPYLSPGHVDAYELPELGGIVA